MDKELSNILEEIKKLPLTEQAKIIKEVERYKKEILEELDAKPKDEPFVITVREKEYVPYPYPIYPRPYRWYENPNPWYTICTTDSTSNVSQINPEGMELVNNNGLVTKSIR